MKQRDFAMFRKRSSVLLGALAALLYSSWPLGYVLNPAVGRHALASELEAPHQPYDWLFIVMDVLTGVLIAVVGLLQLRTRKHSATLFSAVACYVAFGLMVAGAAVIPLSCDPQTSRCGPILHNPAIMVHGAFSIFSVLSLLIGVALVAKALYEARAAKPLKALFAGIALCWAGFGAGALCEVVLRIRDNNVLQYIFISICSVSVAVVVGVIEHLITPRSRSEETSTYRHVTE